MERTAPQLDISPLTKTVARLREGLERHQREPADEQVRDGLIQRFEYTYELCHRLLKRFMQRTAASPEEVDRMAFQDCQSARLAVGGLACMASLSKLAGTDLPHLSGGDRAEGRRRHSGFPGGG